MAEEHTADALTSIFVKFWRIVAAISVGIVRCEPL